MPLTQLGDMKDQSQKLCHDMTKFERYQARSYSVKNSASHRMDKIASRGFSPHQCIVKTEALSYQKCRKWTWGNTVKMECGGVLNARPGSFDFTQVDYGRPPGLPSIFDVDRVLFWEKEYGLVTRFGD